MFLIEEPRSSDIRRFRRDGFLVVERLIEPEAAARLAARFGPLFRGEFETGLDPDEWNWREGKDAEDLTRQICNAWKSDREVARAVLHPRIGLWCARLSGWPGARINQDNVLWKPPGARPLAFHQDDSYQQWVVPRELCTCWMALDATHEAGGTIEYVARSHRWDLSPPASRFHAPDDYEREMRERRRADGRRPRRGAGRGSGGRRSLSPRTDVPRLGHQPHRRAAAGAGVALHVFRSPLPPDPRRQHLRPLQARRQHGDGRILLSRAVDRGRLPERLPRRLSRCRSRRRGLIPAGLSPVAAHGIELAPPTLAASRIL